MIFEIRFRVPIGIGTAIVHLKVGNKLVETLKNVIEYNKYEIVSIEHIND